MIKMKHPFLFYRTWFSLQYRLKFNRCFRVKSALEISRYFSLLSLSKERVETITNDLFWPIHRHSDDMSHWAWHKQYAPFRTLNKILSCDTEFPLYFLEALVVLSQDPYLESSVIIDNQWKEILLKLLAQKNMTLELLISQLRWLSTITEPPTRLIPRFAPEAIGTILNDPRMTPEAIVLLCADPNPRIREFALSSLKCPKEGMVVAALLGQR